MAPNDHMIPDDPFAGHTGQVTQTQITEHILLVALQAHERSALLTQQLAFSTSITRSLSEGVYTVDCAGRITFVNPAAEELLGWQAIDLLGQDVDSVLLVHDAQGVPTTTSQVVFQGVLPSGVPYRSEYAQFTRCDGSTFAAAYAAAPIMIDHEIVGAVIVFRDLTAAHDRYQAQEDFLVTMAHDLRTPLTTILGHAYILHRRLVKAGNQRDSANAQAIIRSSRRLNRMLEDLVDTSSVEAGRIVLRLESLDLVEVVMSTIAETMLPIDQARLTVEADQPLVIIADQARIERVVINLLSNALKYSPSDAPVTLRLMLLADEVRIAVQDHGVGMDRDDLDKIFGKHYRASTVGLTTGTGLGLYGSSLIVAAHGGRMWAESSVGVGSTFWVALPRPTAGHELAAA